MAISPLHQFAPILPLLLIQLLPLLSERKGGDRRKKIAPLNPIPNPQQALKHMNGGAAAVVLFFLLQKQQQHRKSQRRGAGTHTHTHKKKQIGAQPQLSALLCVPRALESRVTQLLHPRCHRSRETWVVKGISVSVQTYRMAGFL